MSNGIDDSVASKSVEQYLNEVDYTDIMGYVPSQFALDFVTLIKLIEGKTENLTPPVHYKMIDNFDNTNGLDTVNMCHRGFAKTTLKEYLIFYIAIYGKLPNLGEIPYALYVSDSIDNGVKRMRKSIELRWHNSKFLQKYVPRIRLTDTRWEFENIDGKIFVVTGHGAQTGVRGTRENNSRPVLALLDDLLSDTDAKSPTVIQNVRDTVYKAVDMALHPSRRRVIWSGTPFNARDPLYTAVESGAWNVNVYPVCVKFPCSEKEFQGSWPDRFDYASVKRAYNKALKAGEIASFNQELMLRIMSEEDRLIDPSDIQWYSRDTLLAVKSWYNFYITTDFATSAKTSADFSVISVWALNSEGHWFWVDGVVKKQDMEANLQDLFRLVQIYKPLEVGIEVSGQQQGFIPFIRDRMIRTNTHFNLTSSNNGGIPGIRPVTDKMSRFNVVLPWFKAKYMFFPDELREDPRMVEAMLELTLATKGAFKSKHDDFIDTISMLALLRYFKPATEHTLSMGGDSGIYDSEEDDTFGESNFSSYIV